MKATHFHILKVLFACYLLTACGQAIPDEIQQAYEALPAKVDFNFHIRPILADRCFACHGPDDNKREAELRLDLEESAFASLQETQGYAFVKKNLGKSIAWKRIISDDPDFQMPPPESHLSLSTTEKVLIAKWIQQGAEWKAHWAFTPPSRPHIPQHLPANWNIQTKIDPFILAKLKQEGLRPSPEARKERLIRRLYMDLTGLPPSLVEIDGFLADNSPQAYENLVDRLLQTDAHAERMAMEWLDVARFGDTQGMHTDAERYHWPWRDWVIQAFKQNLSYDNFISWQIAGDLIPDATKEQKLATAFHRNHPTTSEGGVPDEEFRQKYVQDRTNTTATAFMGLTLECAACHDHKFDPISQKEYYQMSAFFNNFNEIGMLPEFGIPSGPVLLLPPEEVEYKLDSLSKAIEALQAKRILTQSELAATQSFIDSLDQITFEAPTAFASFPFESLKLHKVNRGVIHRSQNNSPINQIVDNNPNSLACGKLEIVEGKIGKAFRSSKEVDLVFLKGVGSFEINEAYAAGAWVFIEKEGEIQSIMGTSGEMGNAWRGWDLFLDSLNRPSVKLVSSRPHNYIHITAETSIQKNTWHHVFFSYDGSAKANGLQLYIDGKKVNSTIEYDHLYRSIIRKWRKSDEWRERPVMVFRSGRFHLGENGVFTGKLDALKIFKQYLSPLEVAALYSADIHTPINPKSLTAEDYLAHYLHYSHADFQRLTANLQDLLDKKLEVLSQVPEIMVMGDMPTRRKTYILNRGQYDEPTTEVFPGTPQEVLPFSSNFPQNRLGLAQWLIDPQNPLTARVTVNRYWQMIFGRGIVETPHDFGIQGALPTHPQLLDWLALDFTESGWDVRRLLKMMVMSATYRQSSVTNEQHAEKDPRNLFLARAPSYRFQAEMIRDNALAASGLLTRKVGGPSVKPYQPEGVWDFGSRVSGNYEVDSAANLYRRSMYTYIRRTTPHPAMTAFDAPNRTVCILKRENTNTPLQALVLLNDPQFVEATRVLAERMQLEGGADFTARACYGFRLVCGRKPNERELGLLKQQYQLAYEKYKSTPQAANDLLELGERPLHQELDKIETATLAMVASTMMNFDEAYMKR